MSSPLLPELPNSNVNTTAGEVELKFSQAREQQQNQQVKQDKEASNEDAQPANIEFRKRSKDEGAGSDSDESEAPLRKLRENSMDHSTTSIGASKDQESAEYQDTKENQNDTTTASAEEESQFYSGRKALDAAIANSEEYENECDSGMDEDEDSLSSSIEQATLEDSVKDPEVEIDDHTDTVILNTRKNSMSPAVSKASSQLDGVAAAHVTSEVVREEPSEMESEGSILDESRVSSISQGSNITPPPGGLSLLETKDSITQIQSPVKSSKSYHGFYGLVSDIGKRFGRKSNSEVSSPLSSSSSYGKPNLIAVVSLREPNQPKPKEKKLKDALSLKIANRNSKNQKSKIIIQTTSGTDLHKLNDGSDEHIENEKQKEVLRSILKNRSSQTITDISVNTVIIAEIEEELSLAVLSPSKPTPGLQSILVKEAPKTDESTVSSASESAVTALESPQQTADEESDQMVIDDLSSSNSTDAVERIEIQPIQGLDEATTENFSSPNSDGAAVPDSPRKTIVFSETVEVLPTFKKSEYNRKPDSNATFRKLTPQLKIQIREELNCYKKNEMSVHNESIGNTCFH